MLSTKRRYPFHNLRIDIKVILVNLIRTFLSHDNAFHNPAPLNRAPVREPVRSQVSAPGQVGLTLKEAVSPARWRFTAGFSCRFFLLPWLLPLPTTTFPKHPVNHTPTRLSLLNGIFRPPCYSIGGPSNLSLPCSNLVFGISAGI